MAIPTLADLQSQIAQQLQRQGATNAQNIAAAQARIPASSAGSGLMLTDTQLQRNDRARSGLQSAQANAAAENFALMDQDPTRSPGAAMDRILGVGEDAYQNAANNPVDKMLMNELQSRISGAKNPYDATTINALQTGAANQSAAAEMANNKAAMDSLEARGFTAKDPAYQAALAANQSQRQVANQNANLGIAQQANLANYQAQSDAMSQANQVNRGQQSQQLAASQVLQNNYNQVSDADRGRRPAWQQMPTYQQYTQTKRPATQS